MNTDAIITKVTEADSYVSAMEALRGVPRKVLVAAADQLYLDLDPHYTGTQTLKMAIVNEARA